MTRTTKSTTTRTSLLLLVPLVGPLACERDVAVIELITRTDADGAELDPTASCILAGENGLAVGGNSSGPGFAEEKLSMNDEVTYRYFIAPQEDPQAFTTPSNGELVAELEADLEFFQSGDTKHVTFESYDGITYDVYLWGEPECEGELPNEPPAP